MTATLVRFEIRRLLRSRPLWALVVAVTALLGFLSLRQPTVPNVEFEVVLASSGAFFVGVGMMVIANLATLRDQRHGMPETLAALPGSVTTRTRAVLVATSATGAAFGTTVIVPYLLARVSAGPIGGRFDGIGVLTGIVAVALLSAVGVALGRWLPALIAVPAVLVTLLVFTVERETDVWVLPITTIFSGDVLAWPSHLRLLYLLMALVLAAALALLRHDVTATRAVAAIVALAVIVTLLGPAQSTAESTSDVSASNVTCVAHNAVTYCHQPGFGEWVPLWAAAVDPLVAALPARVQDDVVVRQYRTPIQPFDDGQVPDGDVGMEWGRGELEAEYRAMLAAAVATDVAGFGRSTGSEAQAACDGRGQARTVLALWLAGQTTMPPRPPTSQTTQLDRVRYGLTEWRSAARLLEMPDSEERVAANWDTLMDPATTVMEALPALGLPIDDVPAANETDRPCR